MIYCQIKHYQNYDYALCNDGTVGLLRYHGNFKDIVVPSEIAGKKVSRICENCFRSTNVLNSIVFPEGLQTIESKAFSIRHIGFYGKRAHKIKEIFIPASLTEIKPGAFNCCAEIETIKVHPNNPVYDSRDNCNAIIDTAKNELVVGCVNTVVPKGVNKIGKFAFASRINFEEFTIPDSIDTIEDRAFSYCVNLKKINLPSKLKKLGNGMFFKCKELNKIKLPDGIDKIGRDTFNECENLKRIVIPKTVVKIGSYAFRCTGLKKIEIPSSVKIMGDGAFCGCHHLESVKMSCKLKKIERFTFWWCNSLKHIELPSLIEVIESCAFFKCGSLEEIIIPDHVKTIGQLAFDGCASAKTVIIGESVEVIQMGAFEVCGMKYIKIPKSVREIHYEALYRCNNLEVIEFEEIDNIKIVPKDIFDGKPNLQKIIIGDSVSKKFAALITEAALKNNNVLLLEDNILSLLAKGQLQKYEEMARVNEQIDICNRFITEYNRRFGGKSRLQNI